MRTTPTIRAAVRGTVCVFVAVFGLAAQVRAPVSGELVTVCEVLGDATKYNGTRVALLGRADCGPLLIDRSCFLAEDRCPQSLVTHGHRWPTKIWLQFDYGNGLPKTKLPEEKLIVEEPAMIDKLAVVRRSTKLGFHRGMVFGGEDNAVVPKGWANLKDQWGVAYGQVVFRPKLKPGDNCSGAKWGCGGWNETPVMLVVHAGAENFTTFPDDKYEPQHKP